VSPGGGQWQCRPRAHLEVLWWARRCGESWRLARLGRAQHLRPPGSSGLDWVGVPDGAAWWGPVATRFGGASVGLVRVWPRTGVAAVARLGRRWRLPGIWSLWYSSCAVGSLGELRWWLWIRPPAVVVVGWWLSILLLGAGAHLVDSRQIWWPLGRETT
jgi:hypothetical protein